MECSQRGGVCYEPRRSACSPLPSRRPAAAHGPVALSRLLWRAPPHMVQVRDRKSGKRRTPKEGEAPGVHPGSAISSLC